MNEDKYEDVDVETALEQWAQLKKACDELAKALVVVLRPVYEALREFVESMEISDPQAAARERSRADLAEKRKSMRGKGRRIDPPGAR